MENIDCELEVTKRSYKHYISVDSGESTKVLLMSA